MEAAAAGAASAGAPSAVAAYTVEVVYRAKDDATAPLFEGLEPVSCALAWLSSQGKAVEGQGGSGKRQGMGQGEAVVSRSKALGARYRSEQPHRAAKAKNLFSAQVTERESEGEDRVWTEVEVASALRGYIEAHGLRCDTHFPLPFP